jgi:hypothetical protein
MRKDPSERLLEWSEKIKKQKLSNKSEGAWCQEQGISYNTFQYWKKRINKRNPEGPKKSEFLEIVDNSWIEISLRGVKLVITKDFDRNGLMYFLSLLKSE